MSKKLLTQLDFNKLEAYNFRFQNLAADPSSPAIGQVYYKTGDSTFRFYNGTAFINLLDRANHSGTQLASTISDFATTVRTNRIDQMASAGADVSMGGFKLTSVAAAVSATDAVNLGQLQSYVNGTDWKNSVRVISTTNLAVLSGLLTIDGITLVANDRVLVAGQTTASANGIYVASSGGWTRATDANTSALMTAGLSVMVTEGTSNADTQWRLTTNDAIVLDTTALTFAQIGAGSSYTQGTGITISGNSIAIDTAVTARKYAAAVGDGSATSIAITHGLGTRDVSVQVYDAASFDTVECDVVRTSTTQVTLSFAVAPAASAYRVVVTG